MTVTGAGPSGCIHQPTDRIVLRGASDPCGCRYTLCEPCATLVAVEHCLDCEPEDRP